MTVVDEIKRMIQSAFDSVEITSASPTHTNIVKQVNNIETPDLDEAIKEIIDSPTKEQKKIDDTLKKVDKWDKGNIGDIDRFTSQQFSNIKGFAENPFNFMKQTVLGKFGKGVGVIALALTIFEAVKWIISQLLKPGMWLDVRFKRDIRDELIAFRRREDQQKLKQGFSNIIVSTMPRLRGGQNQVTNTYDLVRNNNFPENIGLPTIELESSGVSISKNKGRRRFRA